LLPLTLRPVPYYKLHNVVAGWREKRVHI
jgi:hypothetical protein